MNRDAFSIAALLQRIQECPAGSPFQIVFVILRRPARARNQPQHSIHEACQKLALPRVRGLIIADNVPLGDWLVGDQCLVGVERPQHLSDDGQHAHAVADAVRGCEQKIALQLRSQPDRAQLGLAIGKDGSQLSLALSPVVVFGHAWDDPQRNLRGTIRFIVQAAWFLANERTQCRMPALHARERRAELVQAEAALQSDEVDDIALDDVLCMGQFPSHDLPSAAMAGASPMAVCLVLVQKAAMCGCLHSNLPSLPNIPSRYPQAIAVSFFSFCESNNSTNIA